MTDYASGGFIGSFGGKAEHFWVGPDETVISQADLLRMGYSQAEVDTFPEGASLVQSDEKADE